MDVEPAVAEVKRLGVIVVKAVPVVESAVLRVCEIGVLGARFRHGVNIGQCARAAVRAFHREIFAVKAEQAGQRAARTHAAHHLPRRNAVNGSVRRIAGVRRGGVVLVGGIYRDEFVIEYAYRV